MIDEARERLIGVWRLVSYQDRPSVEDEWDDTYGADVDGLIVYDATFTAAYVRPLAGFALALLLPVAYGAVLLMRWWSQLLLASPRPDFQRAASVHPKLPR